MKYGDPNQRSSSPDQITLTTGTSVSRSACTTRACRITSAVPTRRTFGGGTRST